LLTENNKKSKKVFWSVLAVFCLLKITQLLTATESFIAYEETTNGCLANDILSGKLLMGIFNYQAYPHSGGTLIYGLIAVPFFALFGKSIISLKLIPLIFSLITLALWFKIIEKYFDSLMALIFSGFYIFSSDLLCRGELIAWANHCESNLFTISTVWLTASLLEKDEHRKNYAKNLVALGIIAGLGIYFDYIYAITLMAVMLTVLVAKRNIFTIKNICYFLISFIAGFSPWIFYRLQHTDPVRGKALLFSKVFTSRMDLNFSPSHIADKIIQIIINDIPFSLRYMNGFPIFGKIATFILLCVIGFSLIFYTQKLFQKHKNFFYLFPVSFLASFLFIFFFSGFYNPLIPEKEWFFISKYRYYFPLIPFLYFFAAWGINNLINRFAGTSKKYLPIIILAPIMIAGFKENSIYIEPSKFLSGTVTRGYSYWELIPNYLLKERSEEELKILVQKLEREAALINFPEVGRHLAVYSLKDPAIIERFAEGRDQFLKSRLYFGIGKGIFDEFKDDIVPVQKAITMIPEAYQGFCYEGYINEAAREYSKYISLDHGFKCIWEISKVSKLIKITDERNRSSAYRGLARYIMEVELFVSTSNRLPLERIIPKCLSIISDIPPDKKGEVIEGFGYELSSYWLMGLQQAVFTENLSNSNAVYAFDTLLNKNVSKIILASKGLNPEMLKPFASGVKYAISMTFNDPILQNKTLNKILDGNGLPIQ